jgi:hypothetical protein
VHAGAVALGLRCMSPEGAPDSAAARPLRLWLATAARAFCGVDVAMPDMGVERLVAAAQAVGLSRGPKLAATLHTLPPTLGLDASCTNLSDIGLHVRSRLCSTITILACGWHSAQLWLGNCVNRQLCLALYA